MKSSLITLSVIAALSQSACVHTEQPSSQKPSPQALPQKPTLDVHASEPFVAKILTEGLTDPWDMQIDRHGQLWIT